MFFIFCLFRTLDGLFGIEIQCCEWDQMVVSSDPGIHKSKAHLLLQHNNQIAAIIQDLVTVQNF